jgi:two-component system copper resistance phosphate regulon response regulator CusR
MGVRVLVVEDEDAIADYLVRGLREQGYTVERAADGAEEWHLVTTRRWDLVLLDWWLPGRTG